MRRRLSVCLIPAFVLVAAACGANPAPSDDVADAGDRTEAAGTFRLEAVTRVAAFSDETSEFRTTGVVDSANNRSEYREESTGCRWITIGDVYYSELAPQEDGLPPGKRWVKSRIEASDSEALYEQSLEQTSDDELGVHSYAMGFAVPKSKPYEYLDYLREISGEPEHVGEEDVRGVATIRYHATIDVRISTRKMLEAEGWKARNIERFLERVDGVIKADVWVDVDGLVRRLLTVEGSQDAADERPAVEWVTTTEFFDFGLDAEIQPPPDAEVVEETTWELSHEEMEVVDESQSPSGGWESYPPEESYQPPRCMP